MPALSDTELRMVGEVVAELARFRGTSFDKIAKGVAFARAGLTSPAFKVELAEVHRRLEVWRQSNRALKVLAPIAPLFQDLEQEAERILSRS